MRVFIFLSDKVAQVSSANKEKFTIFEEYAISFI